MFRYIQWIALLTWTSLGELLCVQSTYIHVQSRPQTPPSHEEKQSGEISQITWVSAHPCNSVTYM